MAQRVAWTAIVALFAVLLVLAPAKIIREQTESDEPVAVAPAEGGGEKQATGTVVTMEALRFRPATVVVDKGATVRFENKDVAPHTVTAKDGTVDSGTLNSGQTFDLVVEEPFDYVCTIHPSMRATIELSG